MLTEIVEKQELASLANQICVLSNPCMIPDILSLQGWKTLEGQESINNRLNELKYEMNKILLIRAVREFIRQMKRLDSNVQED